MYDANKIIPGLIVFLGLVTFPIWNSLASGGVKNLPELEMPANSEQCVEPAQYMREKHMDLLIYDWREVAIRDGIRTYVARDGKEYDISLTGTCLNCHVNKANFCDRCHISVGTEPNCWDCHNIPGGGT